VSEQIIFVDGRYNGATGFINGGYICGSLARFVDGDAEIRMHTGFPIETPLHVVTADSGQVNVYLADKLLGTASPASLQLDIPTPPDFETARCAGENFTFLHNVDVKGCYVCSPMRKPGSGLRLFIGALDNITNKAIGENLTAAIWRPSPELADSAGDIDNVYVWSALDCPGVYALKLRYPESGLWVLGSCTGSIKHPLSVDEHYIVSSWQQAPADGRKLFMGVAIHSRAGQLMACANQICFDVGRTLP
jgi:hypothetical protein